MYTRQPPSEFFANTPKGKALLRAHYLGPHPIIHFFLERMNLRSIVSSCLGTGSRIDGLLTHAEALEVLIHNIVTSPAPLYRIGEWINPIESDSFGLTEKQKKAVNDDRIARTLDALASTKGRNVFFRLALRILKEFSLSTDRMHFDTTSITFCGEYKTSVSEPAIRHGPNKDYRPDLKQLVFGLNVTSDGAVPLSHRIWSGNRTDDTVHQSNVEALRNILGREDFIYVADSKLCTVANLRKISETNGKFVTVLPRTRKEDKQFREYLRKEGVRWRFLLKIPPQRRRYDPPDIYCTCKVSVDKTEDGYRLIWIRSSQKTILDKAHREESIKKALVKLNDLKGRLNKDKLKTITNIRKAIDTILNKTRVSEFINVKIRSRTETESRYLKAGRPRKDGAARVIRKKLYFLEVRQRKDRLKTEARTDGVFPLISNLPRSRGKREILQIYKYQPYLEKRFSSLKSEMVVAPVYIKKPIRAVGMIHAYYIALSLYALIERTVRLNMKQKGIDNLPLLPEDRETKTPTAPRIFEAFNGAVWYEFEHAEELVTFPLRMNNTQRLLLSLLEVPTDHYK